MNIVPQLLNDKRRLQEIYDLRVDAWEASQRRNLINRELFPNGWSDELDNSAIHWVIEDNGKFVAAGRLNIFNSMDDLPLKDIFSQFDLPDEYPFALFSRLVVSPLHRGHGFSKAIDNVRYNYLEDLKIKFALAISGNEKRIAILTENGWAVLGEVDLRFHSDGPLAEGEHALIYRKGEEVSVWGRNLNDYRKMFSLSDADLPRKILGVADGPASFNSEMKALGNIVVSYDPIYELAKQQVEAKISLSTEKLIYKLKYRTALFAMQNSEETDALIERRINAMNMFVADYEMGVKEGRYVAGKLPNVPFKDDSFDLCLCANLLFLFEEYFTWRTHISSIHQMLRVASEVRIFPLYNRKGEISKHFDKTIHELQGDYVIQVKKVDYEVYKNGNKMLVVKRKD